MMQTPLVEPDSITLIKVIKGFGGGGGMAGESMQDQAQDTYFTWKMRNTLRCKHIMYTFKYPEIVIATV